MRLNLLRESLHIATIICVLDSQRVNKQSNILDLTKADFFQLKLMKIHGKIG